MAQMYFLNPEDPEYDIAWGAFPDPEMYNAECHEALQYMGTVLTEESQYVHQFRHRAVPGTNARRYWNIVASPGWSPHARTRALEQMPLFAHT